MISDFEGTALPPELSADGELPSFASERQPRPERGDVPGQAGVPGQQVREAAQAEQTAEPLAADPPDQAAALLVTISETVERLAVSSERYHARAEQREGVIDHLHSEVDRLRRGERRGLLRPLLVEMCRLRNDLHRQAEDLPGDFDADRARLLLRSYAESVELTLEDSGVVTFAPERGDRFEPRLHRRVGGEPTGDPEAAGRVALVRRSGYLDIDTNTPIAPAEVVLFVPASAGSPERPGPSAQRSDPGECAPREDGPASATGERKEL
jgi:molecular chaperone GrpE